jgi:hypothetical protein
VKQMRMIPDFTIEISNQELNFLDLTIYKGKNFRRNGVLDT